MCPQELSQCLPNISPNPEVTFYETMHVFAPIIDGYLTVAIVVIIAIFFIFLLLSLSSIMHRDA